jgi:hypothetical protein
MTRCRTEASFTWRPASTQSPETRSTLSARCRDDTVFRWLSYAFDTAAGTGTFAWHTLHSTSRFIIIGTNTEGRLTENLGFQSAASKTAENQGEIDKKSRAKSRASREGGEQEPQQLACTPTIGARGDRGEAIAESEGSRGGDGNGERRRGERKLRFQGNIPLGKRSFLLL